MVNLSRAWLKALDQDGFVIHRAPAPRGAAVPWVSLLERVLRVPFEDPLWPVGEAEAQRRLHLFLHIGGFADAVVRRQIAIGVG